MTAAAMLAALRLQMEWGADEALGDAPVDRRAAAAPAGPPVARPAAARAAPVSAPGPAPAGGSALAHATDLAALHAALDAMHGHPLRPTAAHTVAPSGNPAAGLVLLADAPGADDDRSGQAFSGESGARLDRVLASAGLDRHALLLAHLVPWRPPGGRPPHKEETAAMLPAMLRLLALTRPRRLVLMGGTVARLLLPDAPGRLPRGRWMPATVPGLDGPVPALLMHPPELWLRDARTRQATWADLLTLRVALDGEPAG